MPHPLAVRARVTDIESASRPGHFYSMVLTASGWSHEDEGCTWWLLRNAWQHSIPCWHVDIAEKRLQMADIDPSSIPFGRSVTVSSNAGAIVVEGAVIDGGELYRLIDDFDAQLIVQGVNPELVEHWCYGFKQAGAPVVGLSVHGVAMAVREMAKHGEVVECDTPSIVYEDKDEIRLVATATRFVINPNNGQRVILDSTTRALRQLKYQMVYEWEDRPGGGRQRVKGPDGKFIQTREDDPKWFEKAYSKAARNATLPLLREDCKSAILNAYKETPKYAEIISGGNSGNGGGGSGPARVSAPRQSGGGRAAPARAPAKPKPAEVAQQIMSILTELNQTAQEAYRPVYIEISEKFPTAFGDDKKFRDLALMPEADRDALLTFAKEAKGRIFPAPPEDDAPADDDGDPGPAEPK